MTIKVAVIGATGRMGKLALDIIKGSSDLALHAALDSKSELSQAIGADVIFEATNLEVSMLWDSPLFNPLTDRRSRHIEVFCNCDEIDIGTSSHFFVTLTVIEYSLSTFKPGGSRSGFSAMNACVLP